MEGIIPPKWFKKRCDGCSVPTKVAKKATKAKMLRAGCDIHDGEYTILPIIFEKGSPEIKRHRKESDRRLYRNIKLIACDFKKPTWKSKFLAPIYYIALRPFGRFALTHWTKKRSRMPVTSKEYDEFVAMVNEYIFLEKGISGMTKRGEAELSYILLDLADRIEVF